jgi:hypothetical protein
MVPHASPEPWSQGALQKLDLLATQNGLISKSLDGATTQLRSIAQAIQQPHGFFAEMKAPDWIQGILLLVAIIAAFATARSLYYARISIDYARGSLDEVSRGRDIENYLKFMDLFDAAWAQFSGAKDPEKQISFCKLLNRFESTCDLYNRGHLGPATRQKLESYLREMLPQLWANDVTKKWIDASHAGPTTFEHIK